MTDTILLERAKLGDPQAIETLMNQSLQSRGMTATVDRQGDCLEVILEAERVPNRQALTTFVQKGISNLGIQSIQSIRIVGQQTGANYPAWMQELQLGTAVSAAPLNIQPETTTDSTVIQGLDEPTTPVSESPLDQVPPAVAVPSFEPEQPDSSTPNLDELWLDQTQDQTPDFLQELLADNPSSLEEVPDESTDEGLIDFLNELSESPVNTDFPAETTQDQSIFVDELTEMPTEQEFQDLFADSPQVSIDSPPAESWLDSLDTPAGEPDADLLDFLNQPDASAVEPFDLSQSPSDEATTLGLEPDADLSDFPDALSIDQLPDFDPDAGTETFSGDLGEPPEEFLTNLLSEPSEPTPVTPSELSESPDHSSESLFAAEFATEDDVAAPLPAEFLPEQPPASTEDLQQALVSEPADLPTEPVEPLRPVEPIEPSLDFPQDPWMEGTEDFVTALPAEVEPPAEELFAEDLSVAGLDDLFAEQPNETIGYQQPLFDSEAETVLEPDDFPDEFAEADLTAPPWQEEGEAITGDEVLSDFTLEPPSPDTSTPEMPLAEMPPQPDVLEASLIPEPETGEPPVEQPLDAFLPEQSLDQPPFVESELISEPSQPVESVQSATSWFDEEEDIEEIPPDFLQEGFRDEPLPEPPVTTSEVTTPEATTPPTTADNRLEFPDDFLVEPGYSTVSEPAIDQPSATFGSLEAELAALDLTTAEEPETELTDTSLTDTSITSASGTIETDWLEPAADFSDTSSEFSAPDAELAELLSETPEGTAIEPPENWVTEHSFPSSTEPADASTAPEAPTEPTVEPPVTSTASPSASQPELTQDALEAGLGDFREGFVEPPPGFLDHDASAYPEWQADLQGSLDLDADDGTGYIIEDSTPEVEYVPPPLPNESEPEAVAPVQGRSPSWIFMLVLVGLCVWIGGLLGFSLFRSRIGPRPAPPPTSEPPTGESPANPPPAVESPPASEPSASPASPTSANPVPSSPAEGALASAVDRASTAVSLSQAAQSADDWSLIVSKWQQAIGLLRGIPSSSPDYATAQQKLAEYQANLATAQRRANQPIVAVAPLGAANIKTPPAEAATTPVSLTCNPVASTPNSQSVELSNVQFDPTMQQAPASPIVGCITNHTEQSIASVDVAYRSSSGDESPSNESTEATGKLSFAKLEPNQTVPFKSEFSLTSEVKDLTIASISWTAADNPKAQQLPVSISVVRTEKAEEKG